MTLLKRKSLNKTTLSSGLNAIPGMRKIYGVTLVELMMAITIGSIVALGISSVYTSSKRSFKLQEEFSRLQENGRFAMSYIARFVRSAGYSGCSSALADSMLNNIENPNEEFKFQTGIEGYEAAGTAPGETVPALDKYPSVTATTNDFATISSNISASLITKIKPLPKTDILAARVAASSGVEITVNNDAANFRINYTGGDGNGECGANGDRLSGICPGETLIISDCKKSLAFVVTSTGYTAAAGPNPAYVQINHAKTAPNGVINDKTSFQGGPEYEFDKGSELVKVTTKFFYVGKGSTGPALFVKDSNYTQAQELVEGVENLQVLYGEDTDDDYIPNRYVPADIVTDFAKVTAVRLSILLRSVKELPWRTAVEKPQLLGGTDSDSDTITTITSPEDKRLRRTMSMTIKLRNRAFKL